MNPQPKEFERLNPNRKPREPKPRRAVIKNAKGWALVSKGRITNVSINRKLEAFLEDEEIVRVTIKADK